MSLFYLFYFLCLLTTSTHASSYFFEEDSQIKRKDYSFQVARSQDSQEVSVLWWNIFDGDFGFYERKGSPFPQSIGNWIAKNVREILNSPDSPDIVIFSEYHKEVGVPRASWTKKYPYREFFPYSSEVPYRGILVLSRAKPTDKVYLQDRLAWGTQMERDYYRPILPIDVALWTRSYIRLTFEMKGKKFHLLPIHLNQPWRTIHRSIGYPAPFSDRSPFQWLGSLRVAIHILFNLHNPLLVQLDQLEEAVHEDLGALEKADFLVGDFNFPRDFIFPNGSAGYRKLAYSLKDASDPGLGSRMRNFFTTQLLRKGEKDYTFPTELARRLPFTKDLPQMRLDHLFTNGRLGVKELQTLHLAGSDHYPLIFKIR